MSQVFSLSAEQLERIKPFFPRSHGIPRVDDRKVISGIIYVIKHGACSGKTRRVSMARTRRSTIAFCAEAGRDPARTIKICINSDTRSLAMFGRIKDWRRRAMRYDCCAHTFFSALCLAASVICHLDS